MMKNFGSRSNGLRLAVLCAIAASAARVASGASVYTVTLPTGVTNTLSEAFTGGYVTSSDAGETPSLAGLYAAADLSVAGSGRLEINVDLKTAGYTGEVHVVAGAILRITANGALGDTAHGTFVADGATLENECLDTSANNKLAFAGERLSFAGTGVGGVGALVARTPVKQERDGVWGGTYLTMTGDAMITSVTGYQDFPCNSTANTLNMNGHTLTVFGIAAANGNVPGGVCLRPVVSNPGHIVITNCGASISDYALLTGGANHTLTLAGPKATLELYGNTVPGRKNWTLVISENSPQAALKSSSYGGQWEGPVQPLNGQQINLNSQKNSTGDVYTNKSVFAGPFTTTKWLTFNNESSAYAQSQLTLSSSENSFGGPVVVRKTDLVLPVDGALPVSTPSLLMDTSSISFSSDWGVTYSLPSIQVTNAVSMGNAFGSWVGIVTKSGATLTCAADAPMFSTLDLAAGTMTLEEPDANFNAGLYEGHKAYPYWYRDGVDEAYRANAHGDAADNAHTNQVTQTVRLAYESQTMSEYALDENGKSVLADGFAFSYMGYIWNPDPTNVTWSFAASEKTVTRLYINYTDVYGRQAATTTASENGTNADLKYGNATLKPGANHFWWRIGVSGKTIGPYASVKTCATWTDPTKNGLVYDRWGRKSNNPANYERLDGSLFTLTDTTTADYVVLKTRKTVRTLDRLTGVSGAVLNAPSRKFVIAELAGCPTLNVTSTWLDEAGVYVTDSLTAKAADLAADRHLTVTGKLVFSDDAAFSFSDDFLSYRASLQDKILATATAGIEGIPEVAGDAAARFKIVKSVDGKTLTLQRIPQGLILLMR